MAAVHSELEVFFQYGLHQNVLTSHIPEGTHYDMDETLSYKTFLMQTMPE